MELEDDGDLICLIREGIRGLVEGTVCISKVKGHAEEVLVRDGQVRELDCDGNNRADEVADFGRRRVWPDIIDARRNLSGVCGRWYPIVKDLHRLFVAISRAVVNADGHPGLAPDPLVWSPGSLPKRRRILRAVRDAALLPWPAPVWESGWVEFFPFLSLLKMLVYGRTMLAFQLRWLPF